MLTTLLCNAQSGGDWTWISGDNTTNSSGVYGTKGTASATNKPGNRDSHSAWVDASGNFWMFGGEDHNASAYNDLWEYTASTKEWTWVKGSNTINNKGNYGGARLSGSGTTTPGARLGQASWIDGSGNFWVFGGYGFDGKGNLQLLNDLWVFSKASGEWLWAGGDTTAGSTGVYGTKGTGSAGNKPGAREYASGWADASGNIWVFGGWGYDGSGGEGNLNDLWKFNIFFGQWTWVGGATTFGGAAVYGTKGVAAAGNTPGGRYGQTGFADASGNFWIFGGATSSGGQLFNDLWKYSSGSWTWVGGDNTSDNSGQYGTMGVASSTNKPGSRFALTGMPDGHGNIWLFGGYGLDGIGTLGLLNDLWAYNPTANQWTWVSGDNSANQGAVYGTLGTMAATNKPSGRQFSAGAMDASGQIWVMGGGAAASSDHNDLWKFTLLIPLPEKAIELQGTSAAGTNILNWQTQDESGLTRFIVQRSVDGINFSEIGIVAAVGSGSNAYSFNDDQSPVAAGSVYYRLEAEYLTDPSTYSRIIVLTSGKNETAPVVYPNPCKGGVNLRLPNSVLLGTSVKVVDLTGRLIKEALITGQDQYIDLNFPASGVYVLQLANGTPIRIVKH